MVKKKVLTALVVGACLFGGQSFGLFPMDKDCAVAEAKSQPRIEVMDRELKKNKGYEASDIYRRSHEMIYNDEKPGRDGRTRIAVVINGDENMIVEDRIKNQVYSHLRKKFPIDYFAVMKGTDINSRLLQYAEDLYYDQREYATTRDTNFDASNTSTGVSVSVNGTKSTTDAGASGGGSSASGNGSSKAWGGSLGVSIGGSSTHGEESRVTKSSRVDIDGMPVGNVPRGLADMRRMDYVRAGRECNYDYVFVLTLSNGKGKIYGHDFLVMNTNTVTKNVWLRVRLVDVKSGDYIYRNDIAARGETHNGHINGRVLERSVANAMKEAMDDIRVSER